jgi:hypothetical protein
LVYTTFIGSTLAWLEQRIVPPQPIVRVIAIQVRV